jgi:outer membrane receptor protein involved in Fe transport
MRPSGKILSAAAVFVGQLCFVQPAAAQGAADAGVSAPPAAVSDPSVVQAPVAQPQTGVPAGGEEEVVGGSKPTVTGKKSASEEIVVTGSRIRRKDLTTPAPVTVISREQVVASGKASVGDFLQSLPEQGNAINTSVNNGGNGATRISLRGVGAERTLVLINGRRFVPGGNGADSSVDLNSIPAGAIERIEILKDGASAVYGSDAIAGVVNIITRKNFNGTEASVYTATSQPHHDGTVYDVNAITGTSGDKGNATFAAGYYKMSPIFAGDRAFSAIPLAYDAKAGIYSQGSGTIPAGRFIPPSCRPTKGTPSATTDTGCIFRKSAANPTTSFVPLKLTGTDPILDAKYSLYNSVVGPNPLASFIRDPSTPLGFRPYLGSGLQGLPPGGDGFNFQPDNYLVTPQQRISLYSTGDLRLGNFSHGFFEASYVNRQSDTQLAAEPLLTDQEGTTISASNFYNPFGRDIAAMRRRLSEFGYRMNKQDIDTFHIVAGVNGTLSDDFGPLRGWFWEIAGNYGRTQGVQVKQGNLRTSKLAQALGPSDSTGKVCLDAAKNPIPNCVPLNLFGGLNSITPDQIANLTFTGNQRGINQLAAAQFNVGGELMSLFGDKPMGLAAGYEYRNAYGANVPDPITVAGEATGNKGDITQGRFYSNEGYVELSVPIVSNLRFADAIEATAAARAFKYSNFGSDYTYKFGGRWRVVPDLTFRGTVSTAFRAPSISNLYLGQSDSFPPVKDPCRGPSGGGLVPPGSCGTAADNGDNQSQLRTRIGGNPDLKPETARIFTVGAVIEPRQIPNFTITVDYYNIRIFNTITTIGAATILSSCYPNSGPSTFCNFVQRDPNSGRLVNIINTNVNVGQDSTDGIDVSLRYAVPSTPVGRFGFIFDGTWLHNYDRRLADGTIIHGKGNFDLNNQGSFGVFPAIKFNAGVTWALAGFAAGISTRFIGSFTECGDSSGDFSGGGLCYKDSTFQRRVGAYNTYDLFVSYALTSPLGKTSLAAGVLNLADRKPQAIYNGFTAASDPSAYDFVGRYPYVRATQSF